MKKYVNQGNGIYRGHSLDSNPSNVIDVQVLEAIQARGGPLTAGKKQKGSPKEEKTDSNDWNDDDEAETDLISYNLDGEGEYNLGTRGGTSISCFPTNAHPLPSL